MRMGQQAGMMGILCVICVAFAVAPVARGAVKTQTIEYNDGDTKLQGFLAYDDATTQARPGILVVPEWWGLTDYPKHRAQMLAELGYVAFVADMYGDGKTTDDPKQAGEWAGPFYKDQGMLVRRAQAGLAELAKQSQVDRQRMAGIGYCFGGSTVLRLACAADDLQKAALPLVGVVSFHGGLGPLQAEDIKNIKAKVLVQTGADDPMAPMDVLAKFEEGLKAGGVDYQVIVYGHAVHAFTNPAADSHHLPGIAYNAEADHRSWQAMKDFFTEIFGDVSTNK